MSIPRSGVVGRRVGVFSAIAKQLKFVNLKPVKKISVEFDPFHENVIHTRNFLFAINSKSVLQTNTSCKIKTEIVCNRADPSIAFDLVNGEKIVFQSKNLTLLELLQLFNKHVTPLTPKEEAAPVTLKTKASKQAIKRR